MTRLGTLKLTTNLFLLALLASSTVSQAAKLQEPSCAAYLESDPYFQLIELAYKNHALTLADLQQLVLKERPVDPFVSQVENPGNTAIAKALRDLLSRRQTENNWASTQKKILDLLRTEHGEAKKIEGVRAQMKQILSPQLIKTFYTAGDHLAWTAIEGGDVLIAVVTNFGRLRVYRISDWRMIFETELLQHNGLPWLLGWHRDEQGNLSLWMASDIVKKLDWELKSVRDVELPNMPSTWTAESWLSDPANSMLLLQVYSEGRALYVNITDPLHPILPASGLASLIVTRMGKTALAYPKGQKLLFRYLGENAFISIKLSSSLVTGPQIFKTADGRVLVAALQWNKAQNGMFLDVFEPLKSTQAIFHRDLHGTSFDPQMAWFTNKLGQPLLGLDVETDYTSLVIFDPLSSSTGVSQPLHANLQGWIQSGDQVYFWANKDENKIKIYKVFKDGAE